MKKIILTKTIGSTTFTLGSPAPAAQPYLLDVVDVLQSAKSASSKVFAIYALLGLTLKAPAVPGLGVPQPGVDGEVGQGQVLAYGRHVVGTLEQHWEGWGVDEGGVGELVQELVTALKG